MNLHELSKVDASLVQHGLKSLGYYNGTTKGKPGPLTIDAYRRFRQDATSDISFPLTLISIAEKEVGNKEIGNNGGPVVRRYQKATWLQPGPWPWCAAFVCWCIKHALHHSTQPWKRPRTAAAWDFERWAKQQGLNLIKRPTDILPGDIVIYTFSHIGIAASKLEEDHSFVTIEGNTNAVGSREGDGVYRKTRSLSQVRSIIRF